MPGTTFELQNHEAMALMRGTLRSVLLRTINRTIRCEQRTRDTRLKDTMDNTDEDRKTTPIRQ